MGSIDFETEIQVNGETQVWGVAADITIGNSGIGHYECHGFCGYDAGRDYIEEWNITAISDGNGELVDITKLDPAILEQLEKAVQDYCDDIDLDDLRPEPDYDDRYEDCG